MNITPIKIIIAPITIFIPIFSFKNIFPIIKENKGVIEEIGTALAAPISINPIDKLIHPSPRAINPAKPNIKHVLNFILNIFLLILLKIIKKMKNIERTIVLKVLTIKESKNFKASPIKLILNPHRIAHKIAAKYPFLSRFLLLFDKFDFSSLYNIHIPKIIIKAPIKTIKEILSLKNKNEKSIVKSGYIEEIGTALETPIESKLYIYIKSPKPNPIKELEMI